MTKREHRRVAASRAKLYRQAQVETLRTRIAQAAKGLTRQQFGSVTETFVGGEWLGRSKRGMVTHLIAYCYGQHGGTLPKQAGQLDTFKAMMVERSLKIAVARRRLI